MNAEILKVLDFEEHTIRVAGTAEDPLFVAKDVCGVLGIADHKQACERLDDDERGGCLVPTPGGTQQMMAVTEPGLYHLIFTSKKEGAKKFRRWVRHEVLPAIRKTGRYEVPSLGDLERDQAGRVKMTLPDWLQSMGIDPRSQGPVALALLDAARGASRAMGFRRRSYSEGDGLVLYPMPVLELAMGMVLNRLRMGGGF